MILRYGSFFILTETFKKLKKETSILPMFLHVVLIQHGLALRKVEEFEKAIMKYIQQSITYKPGFLWVPLQ